MTKLVYKSTNILNTRFKLSHKIFSDLIFETTSRMALDTMRTNINGNKSH